MKPETQQKLEAVAQGTPLSAGQWNEILADVLADLEKHLGESFVIDSQPTFDGVACSLWLWSNTAASGSAQNVWCAYLSVGPPTQEKRIACVVTRMYFDPRTRERIRKPEGTIVVDVFEVGAGSAPGFHAYGFQRDTYGEWEHVPYPEE